MKIITEPTVSIVGRSAVDRAAIDQFLAKQGVDHWETDTEIGGQVLVETAGRCCYMSFANPRPGGNAAYIDHLIDVGHTSVLEHATWNVLISGVSRSLTHELVRHRVGISPSQLSQRYVDSSEVAFVVPPLLQQIRDGHDGQSIMMWARWKAAMESSQKAYHWIAEDLMDHPALHHIKDKTERRKAAREAARSVLPNSTETAIFLTMNGRAARHLLTLRGSLAADAEIRRLAVALYRVLVVEAPAIFAGFRVATSEGREYLELEAS